MRQDELLVVRLGKGATIVRYVEESAAQVTVALGRNRQARIPRDRVLTATGIVPEDQTTVEELREQAQSVSDQIDLSEVWEVVTGEDASVGLEELADLYWEAAPTTIQVAALAIHLDGGSDYFEYNHEGYSARSREAVEEKQARRRAEAERAEATSTLMEGLSAGTVPDDMTPAQSALLDQLRGYAIFGDDFGRSRAVRPLVENLPGFGDLQHRTFGLLVAAGVLSADEPLELIRAGIRTQFPEEVLAETKSVPLAELLLDSSRKDFTHLDVFTIDDQGTDDRDDALSIEPTKGKDAFRLGVHIADAATLVEPGGAIDREADRRMATLYVPEGRIPMVPPELTRLFGSLDPGQDRLAVSLFVEVGPSGALGDWEVKQSVVRSRAALTYQEVDSALQNEGSGRHETLTSLNSIAIAWRSIREEAGAVNIDRPEMAIKLNANGEVSVTVLDRSSPARTLVAELMILSNSVLAEFTRKEGVPAMYRSQPVVDPAGLPSPEGPPKNEADEAFHRYLLAKRLRPAELGTSPAHHPGLGVDAYIQTTSPLRRYLDLIMQRQISHFLAMGEPYYAMDVLAPIVQRAEEELRELARLEDDRKRYWFLKYLLQDRLEGPGAAAFQAVVLDTPPGRSSLTELLEFPFRTRATLPHAVSPGETVTLKLEGVDLWRRTAQFVHVPG